MNTNSRNTIVAYYKSDKESLVSSADMNYIATPETFLHPKTWNMLDVYKCIRSVYPEYPRMEILKFSYKISRIKKQLH